MSVKRMLKCPTCIGLGYCNEGDICVTCEGTGEVPSDEVIIDEPCQPLSVVDPSTMERTKVPTL